MVAYSNESRDKFGMMQTVAVHHPAVQGSSVISIGNQGFVNCRRRAARKTNGRITFMFSFYYPKVAPLMLAVPLIT